MKRLLIYEIEPGYEKCPYSMGAAPTYCFHPETREASHGERRKCSNINCPLPIIQPEHLESGQK